MKRLRLLFSASSALALALLFILSTFAAVAGDIDNDGKVSAADARLALRASVGLTGDCDNDGKALDFLTVSSREFIAADADSDGKITAADARLILRCSVGLEELSHTHSFGEWQKETDASGVATGRHYRTCECGEKEYGNCTYSEAVEDEAATCTSSNVMRQECSVCGGIKIFAGTTAALGHVMELKSSVPATCSTDGKTVYVCTRCGETNEEIIQHTGHDFSDTSLKDETTLITPATCTEDAVYYYACANCKVSAKDIDNTKTYVQTDSALGHDYTVSECVFGESVHGLICNRCGKADTSAAGFNQLVNAIKTDSFINQTEEHKYVHSINILSKNTMTSKCDNIDFGIYSSVVKKLYAEEMEADDVSYLACRRNRWIGLIPVANTVSNASTPISEISDSDATISVEKISGLAANALLGDFEDTVTIGSTSYDITDLKAKAVTGDVLKVTVKANQEKFFGENGISELADSEKTSLQKLTGYNIRLDAKDFGEDYTYSEEESEDGVYYMKMDIKLNQIVSDATVTYYFDAKTLNPIAAVYDIDIDMSQDVSMLIQLFGSKALQVDGTMSPDVDSVTKTVYLFSDYFG